MYRVALYMYMTPSYNNHMSKQISINLFVFDILYLHLDEIRFTSYDESWCVM